MVEIERERDHLAFAYQLRRRDDVLRRRVVEGADLVVGSPLAPVLVLLRRFAPVLTGDLPSAHWGFLGSNVSSRLFSVYRPARKARRIDFSHKRR
jgi:hypothetical protein